ncbi:MAG: nitronate monooxygenase [Gammaproteobacteria bacterium]|nr:nitronate monooxygenase [Gammaproteobacteria bacterium]
MKNITELLSLKLPVFQAPLTGFPGQERLVAAVSENGALGVYSTTLQSFDEIKKSISYIQSTTKQAFAVTIDMTPVNNTNESAIQSKMSALLSQAHKDLSINSKATPTLPSTREIIDLVIAKKPAAVIFENGLPDDDIICKFRDIDIVVMAVVSNTLEAIAADNLADILIIQGCESAGIHSRFPNKLDITPFPSNTLLQHALANTAKPLVIWGDAQFPQHVVSALLNGAVSVMIDSLLWTTKESPIPQSYRDALLAHNEMQTTVSKIWTGQPAQTLQNKLTRAASSLDGVLSPRKQQQLMYPIIQAAIKTNNPNYMPLWAGLFAISTEKTVADFCEKFLEELNDFIT